MDNNALLWILFGAVVAAFIAVGLVRRADRKNKEREAELLRRLYTAQQSFHDLLNDARQRSLKPHVGGGDSDCGGASSGW